MCRSRCDHTESLFVKAAENVDGEIRDREVVTEEGIIKIKNDSFQTAILPSVPEMLRRGFLRRKTADKAFHITVIAGLV